MTNLSEWVRRKCALSRVGGKGSNNIIELDGRQMTWEDFNELFPHKELKLRSIQLDGRQVES